MTHQPTSPTHPPPSKTYHLLPLLLWTGLWAVFWATILLGLERFPNSDFSGQFDAFARFQAREMLAGRIPLWSDGSFGGVPFVADTQAALFYLPRWLTIGLSAPFGFSYYALQLEALIHVWLAGLFSYWLVFDMTRQRWAGLTTAVSFALGGYLTSYPLLQLAVLETIIWLPLILILLRHTVRPPHSPFTIPHSPFPILTALVLALAFTAGHPQSFLHISYVSAAYFFFLHGQNGWQWRRVWGQGLVIGGVALGASAMMWLPALQFVPLTVRAEAGYDFVSTGQTAVNYLQLWFPSALTFWTPEYIGLTSLVFATFALLGRAKLTERNDPLRHEILFWFLLVLVAAWLSLGDKGILWEAWYYVAPGFQLFRQQERLVGIVALGLAILAGLGMALWWRPSPLQAQRRVWQNTAVFTATALLFLPLFLVIAAHIVPRPWVGQYLWQLLWSSLTIALLTATLGRQKSTVIPVLLVALLTLDLWSGTAVSIDRTPEPPRAIWPQPDWLTILQNEPEHGRIDPGFLFFVNFGEAFDRQSVRGISPLKPQLLEDFERTLPLSRLWPLLNVTHGLFEGGLPPDLVGTPLAEARASVIPGEVREAVLYRYDDPQPRAWLSTDPVFVPDEAAALALLAAPEFDVRRQVVLVQEGGNRAVTPTDQPFPLPQVSQIHPGRRLINVTTAVDTYLVISEWAMPGWHATLNGQSVPLLTVNYGLQGVFLPAGTHEVAVWFRPWTVVVGGWLSLLTLVAVSGWLIMQVRREK